MDEEKRIREIEDMYSTMREEREGWESDWQNIARFMFPKRSVFHDRDGNYVRVGGQVYDGTPISAANILSNGLVGYMVSPGTLWFKLGLADPEVGNIPRVRRWLDLAERVLYQMFHRSNFYEEITEVFRDCGVFGTGTVHVGRDMHKKVPVYRSLHPKEVFIADNYDGKVETVMRRFFPRIKEIAAKFGTDEFTDDMELFLEKSPMERVELWNLVERNPERDRTRKDNKNKKFKSAYYCPKFKVILRDSGYDMFPYAVVRWSVNSDETYGRGPGNDALSEVMKINQISKTLLKSAHQAVDPPLNVPEAMRNRVNMNPGGTNYYQGADNRIYPVQLGQNFPVGIEREQQVRQIIEQYFMVDFFMMLQDAPKGMTATEVIERQTEKSAVLTPVIGRIGSEFLDPMIALSFKQALEYGQIPPPPQEVGEIEIEYRGPLAQAQRRFHRTHGVRQALASLMPLMEINPELRDNIDWDGLARQTVLEEGMPAKHLKEETQVKKEREARMQQQMMQQQAMMQAELGEKRAKAAKDLSQAESATSTGDQLSQALGGGGA